MSNMFYDSRAFTSAVRDVPSSLWGRQPRVGESERWSVRDVLAFTVFVADGGIYLLRDEGDEIRYVGITAHPLPQRLGQHQRAGTAGAAYWTPEWTVTLQAGDGTRERALIREHQPFFNCVHTKLYRSWRMHGHPEHAERTYRAQHSND